MFQNLSLISTIEYYRSRDFVFKSISLAFGLETSKIPLFIWLLKTLITSEEM